MESKTENRINECISHLNITYSYQLAKQMETHKTNPILGFRTAGSDAEHKTGDFLYEEMKRIGLQNVTKDEFWLDSWTFEHAVLRFQDQHGELHTCQMGAYQTNFETDGFETYDLVYVGRGTASDYEGLNVRGKLVLADINQRDEWWINYPVYQAYLNGAVGLIAVQTQGYAEIDPRALNAQDIAGPEYAPAFSLSRQDASYLKELLCPEDPAVSHPSSVAVELNASSWVERNRPAYNITGYLPGTAASEGDDRMILLSAHYDSYFDGFQDDNCAVSMTFGIIKALIDSGYQPRYTIAVCALAAEEWGVCDSKFDWSTGAWNQVFRVHPEWQGRVIADLNFELPAHAHNTQDAIRSTYESADFLKHFCENITVPKEAYPDGLTVLAPIETWSDDFSIAISGIPSTVNDFSAGPFMETHYHSQYDNEEFYQEAVYRFHHELYTRLLVTLDQLTLPPLDFSRHFLAMKSSVADCLAAQSNAPAEVLEEIPALLESISKVCESADLLYEKIQEINNHTVSADFPMVSGLSSKLLHIFRKMQDYFVRLDWQDAVCFPHTAASQNLCHLEQAVHALESQNITAALEALYEVDNNCYAFLFDEEVYYHFTEYILHQPKDRLMWGAGRILHHENLYGLVQRLKELDQMAIPGSLDVEIRRLEAAIRRQQAYLKDDLHYMKQSVDKIQALINDCLETSSHYNKEKNGENQ